MSVIFRPRQLKGAVACTAGVQDMIPPLVLKLEPLIRLTNYAYVRSSTLPRDQCVYRGLASAGSTHDSVI